MKKQLTYIFLIFGLIPAILLTGVFVWLTTQQSIELIGGPLIWLLGALTIIGTLTYIAATKYAAIYCAITLCNRLIKIYS
jgi:thiosulfate reductase cytochrome b subunit